AGAPPVHLLRVDDPELALRIGGIALQLLEAAETLAASFLHDLPRDALVGVVDRCRGPDHGAGELPAALLVGELLVVECEVHRGLLRRRAAAGTHRRGPLIDWSVNQFIGAAARPL